ncbi:uncharacterized protein LOC103309480 isoform X1 [Acyrthosiphon pisum]|uniref:Uncharacterized protein n=1 Tax=Acyrthosiphon pisum TaxID=7029 RepID=A0A8R2H6Q3_ACYPI|nr:uncharacterized protein LOC103309480 isoform X1 [Acyrthosiphon pisum]
MVFSKHNFMIGVVIVHVFFYFNGILVSAKELSCLDALKEDKLDNIIMVKEKINKFYAARETLSNYGTNYVLYLISLVKRPERMLPPETWCEIEDCFISFSSPFSGTEYNNYIEEASEAISKYNKNLYACTINVCYENIITPVDIPITSKNDKKDNNIKDDSIRLKIGFLKLYLSNKKKFFRREPLTWCVIQACYTLLLQQGFDDVPAKLNRELVNKSTARKHTHAHRFFKFINSLESGKKPKPVNIDHTTAEPFDMNLLYEFPSNWCAVQVCYNDLKRVGFVFDTFEKNYEFLPKISKL